MYFGPRGPTVEAYRRAAFRVWHPSTLSEDIRRSKKVPGSYINSYVEVLRRSPVLSRAAIGVNLGYFMVLDEELS